jgi:hypothetical protein
MGMGMGVNPYPPVYMGNPVGLFLCCGYGYGVLIPGGYLPIAISTLGTPEAQLGQASSRSNLGQIASPTDRITDAFNTRIA